MIFNLEKSINQLITYGNENYTLYIKRDDLIHPEISGNKYRKLKYNVEAAQKGGYQTLLTFGGAFSNHIAAVAAVGREFKFKTIGIIRGEEVAHLVDGNPTLRYAEQQSMRFKFISRTDYRFKSQPEFINALHKEFGDFYLIPEGGTNNLAIKGCEEILKAEDRMFDYVCCAVGTGGTIAGLIHSSKSSQTILGFPALKGDFLKDEISKFAKPQNWELISDYHCGGYGKINEDLVSFINRFKAETSIPLDPVYTGKMMFGIFDLMQKGFFPKHSKILAIHTGGLQGIAGMNIKLRQKQMPTISV